MKIFRNLYEWTLTKSSHKKAPWFLSIISFSESSFFPIPPDIILIPMVLAKKTKAFFYALICTISSVLGGVLGYFIGLILFNSIGIILINLYHLNDSINEFKNYYNLYGPWIVVIAGFTPFPFKVITIASGLFQLNFIIFILCSFLSRGARFYLVAGLLYLYGEKIRIFIDRYFNFLTILFLVLLIGSILLIKLL
tara:strand:- start:613 stop:1197 length:585 start_codon:yes stop_codon:yes gene_type:complete